jgi:hypothetical protein
MSNSDVKKANGNSLSLSLPHPAPMPVRVNTHTHTPPYAWPALQHANTVCLTRFLLGQGEETGHH